jgi:hypothetical protein
METIDDEFKFWLQVNYPLTWHILSQNIDEYENAGKNNNIK